MSDFDLNAIFGDDPESSEIKPSALRKQLEAVLAKNKELTDQLASVSAANRQRDVEALFTKHSIPPLAKDFFPADAELTDESATAFVEKYGQLWGAQAQEAATTSEQQAAAAQVQALRSEEHTSELQSHVNLVCRLLLEKKKSNQCEIPRRSARNPPAHHVPETIR